MWFPGRNSVLSFATGPSRTSLEIGNLPLIIFTLLHLSMFCERVLECLPVFFFFLVLKTFQTCTLAAAKSSMCEPILVSSMFWDVCFTSVLRWPLHLLWREKSKPINERIIEWRKEWQKDKKLSQITSGDNLPVSPDHYWLGVWSISMIWKTLPFARHCGLTKSGHQISFRSRFTCRRADQVTTHLGLGSTTVCCSCRTMSPRVPEAYLFMSETVLSFARTYSTVHCVRSGLPRVTYLSEIFLIICTSATRRCWPIERRKQTVALHDEYTYVHCIKYNSCTSYSYDRVSFTPCF